MSPSSRPASCFSRRRLKKQGNPSLRTGKNSTADPHFLFKAVTRICSWRLKTQGDPRLRTNKNSTTYSQFLFQDSSSDLPLETEKTKQKGDCFQIAFVCWFYRDKLLKIRICYRGKLTKTRQKGYCFQIAFFFIFYCERSLKIRICYQAHCAW